LAKPGTSKSAHRERREKSLRARAASDTMRDAYPSVDHLRLTLTFVDATPAPAPQSFVLHPPARAYFEFPCPYSDCDGRFDLAAIARDTIKPGRKHAEGTLVCGGERTRGRIPKQPCELRVDYSVDVVYQD
jgi:hypothetical protein